MEHATTYDTVKLKASTWDGGSLRARSSTLELRSPSPSADTAPFKALKRVLPSYTPNWSDFSLFFLASLMAAESEIPLHKNTTVRVGVKCVQN